MAGRIGEHLPDLLEVTARREEARLPGARMDGCCSKTTEKQRRSGGSEGEERNRRDLELPSVKKN